MASLGPQPLYSILCHYSSSPAFESKASKVDDPGSMIFICQFFQHQDTAPPGGQCLIIAHWDSCNQAVDLTFHPQVSISVAASQVTTSAEGGAEAHRFELCIYLGSIEHLEAALAGGRVPGQEIQFRALDASSNRARSFPTDPTCDVDRQLPENLPAGNPSSGSALLTGR